VARPWALAKRNEGIQLGANELSEFSRHGGSGAANRPRHRVDTAKVADQNLAGYLVGSKSVQIKSPGAGVYETGVNPL
jgi:hypothetical protein